MNLRHYARRRGSERRNSASANSTPSALCTSTTTGSQKQKARRWPGCWRGLALAAPRVPRGEREVSSVGTRAGAREDVYIRNARADDRQLQSGVKCLPSRNRTRPPASSRADTLRAIGRALYTSKRASRVELTLPPTCLPDGGGTAKPRFVRFTFPRNPSHDDLQKVADAINQMRRERLAGTKTENSD